MRFVAWYESPRGAVIIVNETLIAQNSTGPLRMACSGSMLPMINCFSKVYIYEPTKDDIRVGDIVWFKTNGPRVDYILHRIVKIQDGFVYTKGDSSWFRDERSIKLEDILGKVWKIEYGEYDEQIATTLRLSDVGVVG